LDTTVEFLIGPNLTSSGISILESLFLYVRGISGMRAIRTIRYARRSDWLVLYGVGGQDRRIARDAQLARGARTIMWDFGYIAKKKPTGYMRVSLDSDHPQQYFDLTAADPRRFDALNVRLRDDCDPAGPVILVALTQKTRQYLGPRYANWDDQKLAELKRRYPDRKIIYRPKPKKRLGARQKPGFACDDASPIESLLRGASLVVCRHSNVAVDAVIAGVPVECEEGAAMWLKGKPYTPENRLDFLRRLAWWQWRSDEAREAWAFITGMIRATARPALVKTAA
jgi:hypothetical protein